MAKPALNIALQGGGSHGAFAWGILDGLLEEDRFDIAAITATSAGAMNAVVCADGLRTGGNAGAREALARFWQKISTTRGPFSPVSLNAIRKAFDPFGLFKAASFQWFDALTSVASPYEFNPWNFNPLRDSLQDVVDFEGLTKDPPFKLFIAATNVKSGRAKVFRTHEVSADVTLASACLPYLFQAVEVNGEAYWDGGYAGNPSLMPLITESPADDLLLVQINPIERSERPTSASDILGRISEVTFNASLLKEMRSIALLKQMMAEEGRPGHQYRNPQFRRVDALRVHLIDGGASLAPLEPTSKSNTQWTFLQQLHALGRASAEQWLAAHAQDLGQRSSWDLHPMLVP